MNLINFENVFLIIIGISIGTIIPFLLTKQETFITFLVEVIQKNLIQKVGTKRQNEYTNYLGMLFLELGYKLINIIEDIEIKDSSLMLSGIINKIKLSLLNKKLISNDDLEYISKIIKNGNNNGGTTSNSHH